MAKSKTEKSKSIRCSTERINCYGYIVRTPGIDLTDFLNNPIMLAMHERGLDNLIGKWENVRVEGTELFSDPVFDVDDDFGKRVAGKWERGFVNAASIGIRPKTYHFEEMEGSGEVLIMDESVLVEISIVDIPGNRDAVRLYDNKGQRIDLDKVQTLSDVFPRKESPKPDQPNPLRKMDLKAMALELGLAETATEAEVLTALKANKQTATEVAGLRTQLADNRKAQVKAKLDAKIADKSILPGERKEFEELADENFVLFEKTLNLRKPAIDLVEKVKEAQQGGKKLAEGRDDWDYKKWSKQDPKGLAKLKSDDWDSFATLYEKTFGAKPNK